MTFLGGRALLPRGDGYDAQVISASFLHVKRCEKPIAAEKIAAACLGEESPVVDQILNAQLPLDSRRQSTRVYRRQPSGCLDEAGVMENLISVIVPIGVLVGGLIMMFGFRKTDQKPAAFGRIDRALKQDWKRTGNIDFHTSALESSSPQPLRLLVEEKRITEGAVGQDIAELRWRLATLHEGKELVVCWNATQTGFHYSTSPCSEATALALAGSTTAKRSVPMVPRLQNQACGTILTEAGDLVVRESVESGRIGGPLPVGGVEDVSATR